MIKRLVGATLAAGTLLAAPVGGAAASDGPDGLWASTQQGGASAATLADDCGTGGGPRWVDANGYCHIDDYGSVELGVKFTTSAPVAIRGIRVYRVDPGAVTGTLWNAAGEKLASGTLAGDETHSWQDLTFDAPVPIEPGQTYVASYYAPNSDYAFSWYYFADKSLTVGPLTATASIEGDRNGVFCYGTSCGLPSQSYNDTNYWVTPTLMKHPFTGFYQPIDTASGVVNRAKAGSALPIRFRLGGDQGLAVLRPGYPKATKITCATDATFDQVEEVVAASTSGLTYDPASGQYAYVWKSDKAMAGSCYRFELGLNDFSSRTFDVQFTK